MFTWLYTELKSAWSAINDAIKGSEPRKPLPSFSSPEVLWGYMASHIPYTGDPLGGAADFYIHPMRIQAAIENGTVNALSIDCDDFASYAHLGLSAIPGCKPQMYTLRDAGLIGSHVICGFYLQGKYGVIDTNGLRYLPDLSESTLCRTWTDIYRSRGYNYAEAAPCRYPF